MKKVCVILGAGASHDVKGAGSQSITRYWGTAGREAWQPPLAAQLFNINEKPNYEEVLMRYPGARALGQLLAEDTQRPNVSLESELRKYGTHDDEQTRQNFMHIPPYLRDILWACTYQYVSTPSNYVRLVQNVLANHPHDVLFLTLNYDTLLESAIQIYDNSLSISNLEQYINRGRVKVVKLHGSINWFTPIRAGGTWFEAAEGVDPLVKPDLSDIVLKEVSETTSARHGNNHCYPVLTAPLAGKDPTAVVAPDEHVEATKEFLSECQKFLIIGCSGLDDDLLAILNEHVPGTPAVHLVSGPTGIEEVANRFNAGVTAFGSALQHGERSAKFNGGFYSYLATETFEEFLRY